MQVVTFTELRKNLKHIIEKSIDCHEPVLIVRPKHEHMVLVSLENYESLSETAYLLSNESNAVHLRQSVKNLKKGKIVKKVLFEE
jgi:antitoxin YefM